MSARERGGKKKEKVIVPPPLCNAWLGYKRLKWAEKHQRDKQLSPAVPVRGTCIDAVCRAL